MSTRWYPNDKVQGDDWEFVFYRTSEGVTMPTPGYTHAMALKVNEAATDTILDLVCTEDANTALGIWRSTAASAVTALIDPGRYYVTVQETVSGETITLLHGWLKVRAQAA